MMYLVPAIDNRDDISITGVVTADDYSVTEGDTVVLIFEDTSIAGEVTASDYSVTEGTIVTLEFDQVVNTYQWIDENGDDISGETTVSTDWQASLTEQPPRIRVTNPTSGKSKVFRVDQPIVVVQVEFEPNAGQTYDVLVTLPDPRSDQFLTTITQLENQRISNQPTRSTTYYFADDGNDTNDGSESNPWQTVIRLNQILRPLTGNRINANTHTVSNSAGFKLNGRSWWMGGFILGTDGYYGPMFEIENQLAFWMGSYSGQANFQKPLIRRWIGSASADIQCPDEAGHVTGVWDYVEAYYNHTTLALSICVNNGTPYTVTLPGQLDSSAANMTVGGGYFGNVFSGDMARLFFVRDISPTSEQRALMYNAGKGHRSYTLPSSIKTLLTSNNGSFWDLNGVSGTTTYTDAISGLTLTRGTSQNAVVINGPDHDSSPSVSGGIVIGGANLSCLLKYGDKFTYSLGGALAATRQNIQLGAWGTPSDGLPVITARSVTVPLSSWSTTSSHYKCTCDPVGWLFRATEIDETDAPLKKAESAADCNTTNNSFFYDTGAGELHVNIGSNPNGVQFEATPRITDANNTGTSNRMTGCYFATVENIHFRDSGITEPGNASGYGLQIESDQGEWTTYQPEILIRGCKFSGGYHNLGVFSVGGAATVVDNTFYNMVSRNESGTSGDSSGTLFVAFGVDQEVLLHRNKFGGYLPSWDITNSGAGFTGTIIHGVSDTDYPAFHTDWDNEYLETPYMVGQVTSVNGVPAADDWAALRTFVINTTYHSAYPVGFAQISSRGVCGINITSQANVYASGYLIGSPETYSINCTYQANLANNAGDFSIFGNVTTNSRVQLLGCRFNLTNSAGTINMFSASGFTADVQNCIFSETGSGTLVLGTHATAADFANNAWFGATSGLGTNGVLLGSSPSLTAAPSTDSELYNSGTSQGLINLYDKNSKRRRAVPTIGPIEAE